MDEEAVGIVAWVVIAVVGVVAVVGITGGVLYAADTTVGADVTDTDCSGGGGGGGGVLGTPALAPQGTASQVTIETKFPFPGIDHTLTEFDDDTCRILAGLRADGKQPFVEYSIRSGHTVLYREEGGACLYDNEASPPTIC